MLIKLTRIERRHGELLPPWFYGLAYEDPATWIAYFYPMPINWLVRWGRLFSWRWNRFRGRPTRHLLITDDELRSIKAKEYERGREDEREAQEQKRKGRSALAALEEFINANRE